MFLPVIIKFWFSSTSNLHISLPNEPVDAVTKTYFGDSAKSVGFIDYRHGENVKNCI